MCKSWRIRVKFIIRVELYVKTKLKLSPSHVILPTSYLLFYFIILHKLTNFKTNVLNTNEMMLAFFILGEIQKKATITFVNIFVIICYFRVGFCEVMLT